MENYSLIHTPYIYTFITVYIYLYYRIMPPTPPTLTIAISPPRKRCQSGHRHGITDRQRRALRQYWANAPDDAKPTPVEIAAWFSTKFHPISPSTVSDSLRQGRYGNILNEDDLFEEIAASRSLAEEEVPDDDLDPVVPILPTKALAAIQVLKDWEEQQDDSTREVVGELKDLEKRIKVSQTTHLQQQRTLDSYFK